jgi:hypothetical protein
VFYLVLAVKIWEYKVIKDAFYGNYPSQRNNVKFLQVSGEEIKGEEGENQPCSPMLPVSVAGPVYYRWPFEATLNIVSLPP